jgi:hypothetical protein
MGRKKKVRYKKKKKKTKKFFTVESGNSSINILNVAKLIKQNSTKKALVIVNQIWPETQEDSFIHRSLWMVIHWPQQFLKEMEFEFQTEEKRLCFFEKLLPKIVLKIDQYFFDQLKKFESPYLKDASLIRQASQLISEAQDQVALTLLKQLNPRSPFRQVRFFLTGLSASYTQHKETASRCFQRLTTDSIYGTSAQILLQLLQPETKSSLLSSSEHKSDLSKPFPNLSQFPLPIHLKLSHLCSQLIPLIEHQQNNSVLRLIAPFINPADPVLTHSFYQMMANIFTAYDFEPKEFIQRINRAFHKDTPLPQNQKNYLGAYYSDALNSPFESIHFWKRILAEITTTSQIILQKTAIIQEHLAKIYISLSKTHTPKYKDIFFDFYYIEPNQSDKYHKQAIMHYQSAISQDSTNLQLWLGLLDQLKGKSNEKERGRSLEKMVKIFDQSPEVWIRATQAAINRSSFDKALKHLNHAMKLEPINRDLHQLQSDIFCKKACKYFKNKVFEKAEKSFQQAVDVPYLQISDLMETYAAFAAFEYLMNHQKKYQEIQQKVLDQEIQSWLWIGWVEYFLQVLNPNSSSKNSFPKFYWTDWISESSLSTEKDIYELFKLNILLGGTSHIKEDSQYSSLNVSSPFYSILRQAIINCPLPIKNKQLLNTIYHLEITHPKILKLAESAHQMFPQVPLFLIWICQLAIVIKVTLDYFTPVFEKIHLMLDELLEDMINSENSSKDLHFIFTHLQMKNEKMIRQLIRSIQSLSIKSSAYKIKKVFDKFEDHSFIFSSEINSLIETKINILNYLTSKKG